MRIGQPTAVLAILLLLIGPTLHGHLAPAERLSNAVICGLDHSGAPVQPAIPDADNCASMCVLLSGLALLTKPAAIIARPAVHDVAFALGPSARLISIAAISPGNRGPPCDDV